MTLLEALEKLNEYDSQFSVGRFLLVVEDGQRTILYRTFPKEHEVVLDEYDLAILEHRLVKLANKWGLVVRTLSAPKIEAVLEIFQQYVLGKGVGFGTQYTIGKRHITSNAHALAVGLLEFKTWEATKDVKSND